MQGDLTICRLPFRREFAVLDPDGNQFHVFYGYLGDTEY